jgi:hypothetical protein
MTCTITKNLQIVKGTRADYESLSQYHYRRSHLGPYAAIYALKGEFRTAERLKTAGVIVYTMPAAGCKMRSRALEILAGLDRITRLKLIGKNIRTISRVIIEPRFRSLGLAARLVRETMLIMNVPFIEALAVMGRVNPFFEKAGMRRFDTPPSAGCVRLTEAFGTIGIDEQDLIDPQSVQQKLDELNQPAAGFIEREIAVFLQGYGKRRLMRHGKERTRFITGKLTDSPVYYLWKNPEKKMRI